MRAQGWEPGKFLGAQNSAHSHLHSAASSAPIKVVLKDDTMGLGAKQRQKQSTECTGLDGFKDLLGRLNGKSEDVIETEQKLRSDIKTSLYVERRYGSMRFVNGGLLVGDQMKELVSTDPATLRKASTEQSKSEATEEDKQSKKAKKDRKTKKRKAEEGESTDAPDTTRDKKRKKRSKEGIEQHESTENSESRELAKKRKKSAKLKEKNETDDNSKRVKKEKKSKKSKDKSSPSMEPGTEEEENGTAEDIASKEKADKKMRKKEKREKKLEKSKSSTETPSTVNLTPSIITPAESRSSTPAGTGASTPVVANRHHVRARFIASKRSAIADMHALNQVRSSHRGRSIVPRELVANIFADFYGQACLKPKYITCDESARQVQDWV